MDVWVGESETHTSEESKFHGAIVIPSGWAGDLGRDQGRPLQYTVDGSIAAAETSTPTPRVIYTSGARMLHTSN